MPAVHGKNAAFKITDAASVLRDLSAQLTDESFSQIADILDVTAFGATSKAKLAGVKDASGSFSANYDATTDGYLAGIIGVSKAFEFFPNGTTTGSIKYSGNAIINSYEVGSSVGDASKISVSFEVDGAVTRTVV